jgi:putative transposase
MTNLLLQNLYKHETQDRAEVGKSPMSRTPRDMGHPVLQCSSIKRYGFARRDGHPSQTNAEDCGYDLAMPWGLERFYGTGDLHFITSSCYRRQPLLAAARDRDLFVQVLEQVRQRYQFVVVAYVVMPEHFHLLIAEPEKANPSVVIQALKLGVARRMLSSRKRREKRKAAQEGIGLDPVPQHIWQARFYDYNVWTGLKQVEKVKYTHRNPVRRGIGRESGAVAGSSFRAYAFGEAGPVRVNDWTVHKMKIRERETFTSEKPKTA